MFRTFNVGVLVVVLAVMMVLVSGVGSSAACNSTLGSFPIVNNTCAVTTSLTLERGIYYINGSGSSSSGGAITIEGSNLVFDGNGSTIIGNFTSAGIFQFSTPRLNVTIRNITLINYGRGIFLRNGYNVSISNNTLINITGSAILLRNESYGLVYGNSVRSNQTNSSAFIGINVDDTDDNFREGHNRIINNLVNFTYEGISIEDNPNSTVIGNIVYNTTFNGVSAMGIQLNHDSSNSYVFNNSVFYSGWNGLDIDVANTTVYRNYVYAPNHNGMDLYDGITTYSFSTASNNNISYNDFLYARGQGILVVSGNSNLIQYNNISYSSGEDIGRIGITVYGNGTKNYNNNISHNWINKEIGFYSAANNTLWYNNTLINNSQYNIRLQGFFVNSNFNRDTSIFRANVIQGDILRVNLTDVSALEVNTSFYENPQNIIFTSETDTSGLGSLYIYNLTNALLHNGTAICTGSFSDINSNDNNINFTLRKSEGCSVLDNFNLTEGITRQFSPLSISGSATSKTITSGLTQSITATVVVNVETCSIDAEYEGNHVEEDSCGGGVATFTLTDIPAGTSELVLVGGLTCEANERGPIIIILAFTALAIAGCALILVVKWRQDGEIDMKLLLVVFICIMVGIAFFISIAQNLGDYCPGVG